MLTRLFTACQAPFHSPAREQREVLFAEKKRINFDGNPELQKYFETHPYATIEELQAAEQEIERQKKLKAESAGRIEDSVARFRSQYRAVVNEIQSTEHVLAPDDYEGQRRVREMFEQNKEFLRRFPETAKLTNKEFTETRNTATLARIKGLLEHGTEDPEQMEPIGEFSKSHFLKSDEYTERYKQQLKKVRKGKISPTELEEALASMPSAFNTGNVNYFNIDHHEFREDLSTDPNKCMERRDMAVVHELTHFELYKPKRGNEYIKGLYKDMNIVRPDGPDPWGLLKNAVEQIFGRTFATNNEYVHEILAIYFGEKARTNRNNSLFEESFRTIRSEIDRLIRENPRFAAKMQDLEGEVVSEFDHPRKKFEIAVAERRLHKKMEADAEMEGPSLLKYEENPPDDPVDPYATIYAPNTPDDHKLMSLTDLEFAKQYSGWDIWEREKAQRPVREEEDAVLHTNISQQDLLRLAEQQAGEGKVKNKYEEKLEAEAEAELEEARRIQEEAKRPKTASELMTMAQNMRERITAMLAAVPSMPLHGFKDEHGHKSAELDEAHAEGVRYVSELLNERLNEIPRMEEYIQDLADWSHLPINKKAERAREWNFKTAGDYADLVRSNQSTRIEREPHVDAASKEDLEKTRKAIQTALNSIDDPLKTVEDYQRYKEGQDKIVERQRPKTFMKWLGKKIGSQYGTEWLCVYDIVKIFKIYKEAIVESYHAQQNVVTGRIAKDASWVMDYVPWGAPVKQIINRQTRSSNDEETHKYLEFLQKEGFHYDQIFEENGLLDQNRNNINRAKAVLEYAADHAWLYEMDRFNGHDVYGVDYMGAFGRETFRELVQKNESGKKKEEDRGYERIDKDADVPPIIDVMIEELEEKNIFAVHGLLKRLQEKAKYSHSNAWGVTTLLSALRGFHTHGDKTLLRILDKGFLDQLGNIGIGQSAWSLTMFKTMRSSFMEWKANAVPFEDTNELTRAITEIENRFSKAGAVFTSMKQKNKDEEVAKVLAGKTVTHGDVTISIFEDNPVFNTYRRYWLDTAQTSTSPGDTDDDYFNPGNGGSDILLLGKSSTQAILVRTSQGMWTLGTKAPNYMASVIMRDHDLLQTYGEGSRPLMNYRREMKEKLSYFIKEAYTQGATLNKFPSDETLTNHKQLAIDSKNILHELWRRQIVGTVEYIQFVEPLKKSNTIPKEHLPAVNLLKKLKKDAGAKAKAEAAKKTDADERKKAEDAAKDADATFEEKVAALETLRLQEAATIDLGARANP